jgi:hypothetical protein
MTKTVMFLRHSSRIRARRINRQAKYAVKDPGIATQELLKWHMKYTARDHFIASRELAK